MRVVWGLEAQARDWLSEELDVDLGECRTAVVLSERGELAAAVAFHNWNPKAGVIEVTAAASDPRWASRAVLRELFGYVFAVAQAAVARTAEDNVRVRRLWKAFGAQEHVIPRIRGREASEAVLVLTDDAWARSRFMRGRDGQGTSAEAA